MQPQRIPWHEREFLSIIETADVLARSVSWVREAIRAGALEGFKYVDGSPPVVTVASIRKLRAQMTRMPPEPAAVTARHPRRKQSAKSHLRLVVDNA